MSKHLLVVLSNATDGGDKEFNEWYTNTHLGDVLALDGFTAAQRFALSKTQLRGGEIPYRYLALYEVDESDLEVAAASLQGDGVSGMYISPTLDRERTVAWFYSPVTERVTS